MQIDTTIKSVDQSLDTLTKSLPHEMVEWLKQRFQSVLQNLLSLDFADIRVDFVVDTNTIINSLLRHADGKTSILFRLINNQIFKFHAPAYLEDEIAKFITTTRKKVNKTKLIQGWMKIKNILKIGSLFSINALNLANVIIGNRDPKDIPFVAMYIDLGACNIVTYDKDFEHPLLRPLKIDKVGQVIAGVYRGLLSFFILNDLTPSTLNFLGQVVLGLVKILFDAIKLLLDFSSAVARKAMDEAANLISIFFPQFRNWIESGAINAALLAIALIAGGFVIIDKDIRNNLFRLTNLIMKSLQPTMDKFVSWLDKSIRFLVDLAKILLPHIVNILVALVVNILTVVSHVKVLPSFNAEF
jgi:predicted nucleic acid-binding protein